MELSDDVIGWVGGLGRQNIGKDTESKISGMFIAGGRFGAGGADRAAQAAKVVGGGGGASAAPTNPGKK